MADIDANLHAIALERLQAPGDARRCHACGPCRARHRLVQCTQRSDRRTGVGQLDRPGQRRGRQLQAGANIAPAPTLRIDRFVEVVAATADRIGTYQVGARQHARRRIGLAQDHRLPAADDARLLGTDGLPVLAQPFGVIDVHGGDHRHVGVDDVDRIQAAAKADFQHGQIEIGIGEQLQRGQRSVLEISQRHITTRCLDRVERSDQCGVIGVLAIDAHTLVVAQQVR
ncbi:hypothetical protein D3C73_927880 [compost metagenome]